MTQDKIIAAAREAGFRTGNITLTDSEIAPIPFIAPLSATDCQHEVARLYAIAYRQGLEDAVSACDETMAPINIGSIQLATAFHAGTHACIDAIRALEEQPNG